jgi:hypothetical protein
MDNNLSLPRVIPPTYRRIDMRLNDAVRLKMEHPDLSYRAISRVIFGTEQQKGAIRYHFNRTVYGSRRARPLRLSETILSTITKDPTDGGYQLCARCGEVMSTGDILLSPSAPLVFSPQRSYRSSQSHTCPIASATCSPDLLLMDGNPTTHIASFKPGALFSCCHNSQWKFCNLALMSFPPS